MISYNVYMTAKAQRKCGHD